MTQIWHTRYSVLKEKIMPASTNKFYIPCVCVSLFLYYLDIFFRDFHPGRAKLCSGVAGSINLRLMANYFEP